MSSTEKPVLDKGRFLKPMVLQLNRSKKLEGQPGFYNGKPVTSRYVLLPAATRYVGM